VYAAANADEALDRARMATSLIDLIIANLDLTGDDDGLAVIEKTRLLLDCNVPAVLLTTQTSVEIGKPELLVDVSLLRTPANMEELNALIGEVLKRPRRSRLAHLRTTRAKLGHDAADPQVAADRLLESHGRILAQTVEVAELTCNYVWEDSCMTTRYPEPHTSRHFQGLNFPRTRRAAPKMTTMTETMNMRVRMRHPCARTTKAPKPARSSMSNIRIGWMILKMTTPMKRGRRIDGSFRALVRADLPVIT